VPLPKIDSCLGIEQLDDIADRVQKMRERWDSRLVFPLSKPFESYLSGQLNFYLLLKEGSKLLLAHLRAADDDGSGKFHSHVEGSHDHNNVLVLINSVQVVDDGKRLIRSTIPSVVRLYVLDDTQRIAVGRDALYLSVVNGNFIFRHWLFDEYGEGNGPFMGPLVGVIGKHPHDMVERGPEMINNLASKDAKPGGDASVRMPSGPFIDSLLLLFADSACGVVGQEGGDFGVEIADVFVGPF